MGGLVMAAEGAGGRIRSMSRKQSAPVLTYTNAWLHFASLKLSMLPLACVWVLGSCSSARWAPMAEFASRGRSGSSGDYGDLGGEPRLQPERYNVLVNVIRAVGLHPKLAEMQHCNIIASCL